MAYSINVGKWMETAKNAKGEMVEQEATLVYALQTLINNLRAEKMPRGFEKFKIFSKLYKAFEEADKTDVLVLEDREYKFLKTTINEEIPAQWGARPDIMEAFQAFMDAKDD